MAYFYRSRVLSLSKNLEYDSELSKEGVSLF